MCKEDERREEGDVQSSHDGVDDLGRDLDRNLGVERRDGRVPDKERLLDGLAVALTEIGLGERPARRAHKRRKISSGKQREEMDG